MATVLLVDDDPMILEFCNYVLTQKCGLHVITAADGCQAIELGACYGGSIDLLLTDISMPGGISGVDVAERVKLCRPEVKILLMSGLVPENFVLAPSWHFLAKPFRPSELIAQVNALLGAGVSQVERRVSVDRRPPQIARPLTLFKRVPARK